jgi:tetratricopeptide (TPR) repeat protein
LSHLEQAVAHAALISIMDFQSHRLASLGEVYLLAGRVEDARVLAMRALDLSQVHKERGWEAYVLRLLGDIAVRGDPPAHPQGEAYYQQAETLAAALAMRPLMAHCHLGLGTLYAKVGKREQARAQLSAAIDLYRAMDMAFWLPQAEAALGQVEER